MYDHNILSCHICFMMLLILQEFWQSHPYLMLQNCETQGCLSYSVKHIKSIFAHKGQEV